MRLLLSLALLVGLVLLVPAADEQPDAGRIARLVAQLGSKDFEQRDAASRQLDALGTAALPALRAAAADSKDPETRRRAESLIAAIEARLRLFREFASAVTEAVDLVHQSFILEVPPGELAGLAIRGLYDAVGEDLPPDVKKRLATSKKMTDAERGVLLFDARFALGVRGDLADKTDIHHAIRAMIRGVDIHGSYVDFDSNDFQRDLIGSYVGVGLELEIDAQTQMLRVVTPLRDGPAHQAGIVAGDLITHITRREDAAGNVLNPPEVVATNGRPLAELSGKLLGKLKSKVEVTLHRTGEAKPLVVVLTRDLFSSESVLGAHRRADASWDHIIDKEKRIGYVRLKHFSRDTGDDVKKAVEAMEKDGLKGLVLDLRFNPGGLFHAASQVGELFVGDGDFLHVLTRKGRTDTWKGKKEGSRPGLPMVCLVNSTSASAGEIVAACLQDHKRAVIFGERTSGKGSAQQLQKFEPTARYIFLTTALFLRPNGAKLDRIKIPGHDPDEWGVKPDRVHALAEVERTDLEEHLKRLTHILPAKQLPNTGKPGFTDRQLAAALEYLRSRS